MIFVTVGADLPFDRLVKAVDDWAGQNGREDFFAQVGDCEYVPRHMQYERFLSSAAFSYKLKLAEFVISHAGTGTILSSLKQGKRMLVMPRRRSLNEARNEHQWATARYFKERGLLNVALDEVSLCRELERRESLPMFPIIGPHATPQLIEALALMINGP
jgi:UDP-N-acetylglucosamine transferase subunit ALG13